MGDPWGVGVLGRRRPRKSNLSKKIVKHLKKKSAKSEKSEINF